MIRLNKFLATAGIASRRKCDDLISNGEILVNGKTITELGTVINEKKDVVTYKAKEVKLPCKFVYFKMNKPKGYICSASDEKGRKTIFDLIKEPVRLFSIGRLDYDTEGLIILTNDGELTEKVSHPKNQVEKEYHVTIEGKILESELAVLRKGVVFDGSRLPSAKVKFLSEEKGNAKISVIIDEGQNHQVKKMFEGIGRSIVLLKRVRVGSVMLKGLPRGLYKPLTQEEISSLMEEI